VVNLYRSLSAAVMASCRRTRRNERQPVQRMSERDRELMECFRNR
jgi:hypothetical protein